MDQQNTREVEPAKPSSTPSVFVNSQPMKEEQVQNAVKFLSHPKVKGSPVIYKRSFLEKNGLIKEEIDEAFRRVTDSAPTMQTSGVNQGAWVALWNLLSSESSINTEREIERFLRINAERKREIVEDKCGERKREIEMVEDSREV